MYNSTKNYRDILSLYTQILNITNKINTIEIANINLRHDMQLTRDYVVKIIGKFEIQSKIVEQDLCKSIWNAPTVAQIITPPVTPIMSYSVPALQPVIFTLAPIIDTVPISTTALTVDTVPSSDTALTVLVRYGPVDKKKVVVPNSFTHRIIYFTDNYGVEWRPITKKSIVVDNIDELVQNNIAFCHHKITKELFKLLVGNYTLFLAIDHTVYYHNVVNNSIEKFKNKHTKYALTVVKWISAIKKNNIYMQGYLNRNKPCVVTRENYKTLSIQNYILF